MTEPDEPNAEDVVEQIERDMRQWEGEQIPLEWWIPTSDLQALIASWRERGGALAEMAAALKEARPFVNLAVSQAQDDASPRWCSKATAALSAIDEELERWGEL